MKIRWSRLKDSDCLRTKNRLKILSIWQNLCNTSAYTRKLLIYPPPRNLVICASSNKASWRISNINSFSVVSRLILSDSQTYWNCSANPLSLVLAPVTWRTFSFSTIESQIWELVRDDNRATRTINPEAVRVNKLLTRRSWSALTKYAIRKTLCIRSEHRTVPGGRIRTSRYGFLSKISPRADRESFKLTLGRFHGTLLRHFHSRLDPHQINSK